MLRIRYALAFCLLFFAAAAYGQGEHPQTWMQDIALLEQLTPAQAAAQHSAIQQIRADVANWLAAHPSSRLKLPAEVQAPLTADQAAAQVADLKKVVQSIVAADPSHPFHLGITEVHVSATLSAGAPGALSVTQQDIQRFNAVNDTKAIDMLPGVEIAETVGKRNEAIFNIRGVSSAGRIPLYLDGIPIYVPYDGNLDLSRFLSSDVAEIQVAKGFSSPLQGPGALGGAVNIVSKEPYRKFEGDSAMGGFAGSGLLSSVRLATKLDRFYAQGTLDWLQNDYVPLSGKFSYPAGGYTYLNSNKYACYPSTSTTNCNVPYALADQENNSSSRDEKWAGRIGWTPKNGNQYVFSYINQKGKKDVPLYMGADPNYGFNSGGTAAFWRWPYWNKNSYYFLSDTGIGSKSSLKVRVFYDQFRNSIDMFDNSQFASMLNFSYKKSTSTSSFASGSISGSEHSSYDDHSDGASAEYTTRLFKNNILAASFFFKDDTHKELNIYPGATSYVSATDTSAMYNPVKQMRNQQSSIGAMDQITITNRLHGTIGFSADHIKGLMESAYRITGVTSGSATVVTVALVPFTCQSNPTNTSFSGCMDNGWTVNPQASLSYTLGGSNVLYVTYEDRGDFPTMKALYSASMGAGLPNPDLGSEHSQNWNFGYSHHFSNKVTANLEAFRADIRNAIEAEYILDVNNQCPNQTTYSGYCSYNLNVGKEAREGIEASVHSRPFSRLALDANYSYLNRALAVDQDQVTSSLKSAAVSSFITPLMGIPKHKAIGAAVVRLPFNMEGTVVERYEGGIALRTSSGLGSKYYSMPFASTDMNLTLRMDKRILGVEIPEGKSVSAQAGIKNLFDRNYFLADGFPEAGRNWFVNMRYHF